MVRFNVSSFSNAGPTSETGPRPPLPSAARLEVQHKANVRAHGQNGSVGAAADTGQEMRAEVEPEVGVEHELQAAFHFSSKNDFTEARCRGGAVKVDVVETPEVHQAEARADVRPKAVFGIRMDVARTGEKSQHAVAAGTVACFVGQALVS